MNNTSIMLILSLLIAVFSSTCKKKESISDENIDFATKFSVTSTLEPTPLSLVVTIKMDPAVHAYAPSEKIGKPIRLEIISQNGWQAEGPTVIPGGIKKNLGDLGESVVLKNEVIIRQYLKKGTGPGKAVLFLQLCTDKSCDRPRHQEINF